LTVKFTINYYDERMLPCLIIFIAALIVTFLPTDLLIVPYLLVVVPTFLMVLRFIVNNEIFPMIRYRSDFTKDCINYRLHHKYPGRPVVLFCNGNTGSMSIVTEYTRNLCETYRLNLCYFDYSGYGNSPGSPSCKQILKDGEFVYNELLLKGFHENEIIVWGVSIGTGVASHLAKIHTETKACILTSPYTNIVGIILGTRLGILLNYLSYILMNDPVATYKSINKITSPVILIHGIYDFLISQNHSKYLANTRKQRKLPTFEIYVHQSHGIDHTPKMCRKIGQYLSL
jgi:uncharacterized protein